MGGNEGPHVFILECSVRCKEDKHAQKILNKNKSEVRYLIEKHRPSGKLPRLFSITGPVQGWVHITAQPYRLDNLGCVLQPIQNSASHVEESSICSSVIWVAQAKVQWHPKHWDFPWQFNLSHLLFSPFLFIFKMFSYS